jgi:hypothetical protein
MTRSALLAVFLFCVSCAFADDTDEDEAHIIVQKEIPCIIFPNYRGKVEINVDGDRQWQMFITGGGRYCNVWAMYPEQFQSWKKAGEPQPYTPEYTAWCKANPPRYVK